jgi:translation elongation factor EF-Tu-like GTPase
VKKPEQAMIKNGYFQIETSFNITGSGIVAVGQIIEGIPKLGHFVNISIGGKEELLKIIGVERGNLEPGKIEKPFFSTYVDP